MYISNAEDIILYLCFSVSTMALLLWKFDVSLAERNRLESRLFLFFYLTVFIQEAKMNHASFTKRINMF